MSKRSFSSMSPPTGKRRKFRRVGTHRPFGFDTSSYLDVIDAVSAPEGRTHLITNTISSFVDNDFCRPVFSRPGEEYSVEKIDGMFVKARATEAPLLKAQCHTSHTLSQYKAVHGLYTAILSQPRVSLVTKAATNSSEIDISSARNISRHTSEDSVWVGAKYGDCEVVLKTSTRLSTMYAYLMEALVHERLMRKSASYVPRLIKVAFETKSKDGKDRLVLCSEQLKTHKSVYSWLMKLRGKDCNIRIWKMLRYVCVCLGNIQEYSNFTHRDCHCSNVYYDEGNSRESVKFIDFDWSSIMVDDKVLALPRYLYDTDRASYGKNRSVDLCVFLRTLGNTLGEILKQEGKLRSTRTFTSATSAAHRELNQTGSKVKKFIDFIWQPLMKKYEIDSRSVLQTHLMDRNAQQLIKLNRATNGKFSHMHAIASLESKAMERRKKGRKSDGGLIFDYRMGHYEYQSMTPGRVIDFLNQHRSKMF